MVKYCDLFWSFFKVGTFTIGGGYAMLPLMQRELVDRHRWMGEEEFLDQVALSQSMPGVFAVNMASMTGFRLRGRRGAAVAVAGNILMPIVFILLLAIFFRTLRDNHYVERIFCGLRPAVVALMAAPVFTLFRAEWKKIKRNSDSSEGSFEMSANSKFRTPNSELILTLLVPLASALLIWACGVSPIVIVLAAAALGVLSAQFRIHNS